MSHRAGFFRSSAVRNTGVGAVYRPEAQKMVEWGTPEDYGGKGDGVSDDTSAIVKCATAKGGVFLVPGKTYICDAAQLPASSAIFSVGRKGKLKQPAAPVGGGKGIIYVNSGAAGATVDNLALLSVTLEGSVGTQGFSQFVHLASFNGVRNLTVEDCLFTGFRGDGLYVGSGIVGGDERHNYNVRVIGCDFDGVNKDNRNAISVIDVDGLVVERCGFANCTRADMPGAIDLEPDAYAFHVIKNVRIALCRFSNIGGNVGAISIMVPAVVAAAPRNIHVIENTADGLVGTGAFLTFRANRAPTATSDDNDLQIIGNNCKGGGLTLQIFDAKRVRLARNTFSDFTSSGLIGYTGVADKVRDLDIDGDRYIRCGSAASAGLTIFQLDYARIRATLDDCGSGVGGNANGLHFNQGASSYINIEGLRVVSPTGKTLIAIQKEASHNLTPSTNRYVGNNVGALNNFFQAEESDELESSYSPIVAGSGAAGVGGYARQYGRFHRLGKRVFVAVDLAVNAGHTGTGMIQVSLPVAAKAAPNNELRELALSVDGVATTGGQIGQLNPATVVDGVQGGVRCYHTGTGVLQQTVVPAGAFTVRFNGSYEAA